MNRLYVHIPFCSSKCDYCAFHSIPSPSNSLIDQYFDQLKNEIKKYKNQITVLDSIYFGGGTPSLLSQINLEKLFALIYNNFTVSGNAEISIECNPDSLTKEKIKIISNFTNRVSIGIQSFNEKHREILGRKGSIQNLQNSVNYLIKNKLDNISFDLIYGIPNQTLIDFEKDLKTALNFPVKHISLYSLTFEEGTWLVNKLGYKEKEFEELSAKSWNLAGQILNNNEFRRYEVSNYSLNAYECKHNLDTWFGGKYLGLGPTASSFNGKIRWTNKPFYQWINDEEPEVDEITNDERFIEIFIMGLRTSKTWLIESEETNINLSSTINSHVFTLNISLWGKILQILKSHMDSGYISIEEKNNKLHIGSTNKGKLFWDSIALEIMSVTD